MNADHAGTRSPHLDLADLIAEAAGQPIAEPTREHLASCETCRLEANRWNLVADGVRGLAAATPEAAQPDRPRRTRPRVLAGPRRRTVLAASAAAAAALLGGAGYWATAALTGHAPGTVLTAVRGCPGVVLADGTLERMTGGSLVIKTAGGQPVTVTTAASTTVSVAGAPLSDVTDGAPVIVLGPRSGATIAAAAVTVGPPPMGNGDGTLRLTPPPGWAAVQGTVSDASTAGFTVVTSGGTRVPVTTSGDTRVMVPHASLGQLRAGATTVAVGRAGPRGTLTAAGVLQQPSESTIKAQFNVTVRGCSPDSLATALAAALGSGS